LREYLELHGSHKHAALEAWTAMGNSCAQECCTIETEQNFSDIPSHQADSCVVLYSARSSATERELPRLGLVKQQSVLSSVVGKELQKPRSNNSCSPVTLPPVSKEDAQPSCITDLRMKDEEVTQGAYQPRTPRSPQGLSNLFEPQTPMWMPTTPREGSRNLFESVQSPSPCEDNANTLSGEPCSKNVNITESRPGCLEIVFEVDGKDRSVNIFRRPLGAEFGKQKPSGVALVKKVQPQSYAAELGLQVGWIVKSVNGEDMGKMSFGQIQDSIKTGIVRLPVEP